MKKDIVPKKPWRTASFCGGVYFVVGILMFLSPEKTTAWTMIIGGTILLCLALITRMLADIRDRLNSPEQPEQSTKAE